MATATALTSDSALALVQEFFTKGVRDGTKTETFFFNTVKTATDFTLAGKHAVFSINFQRSSGLRAAPLTGGSWPAATSPNPQQFMVGRAIQVGTVKWEEQAEMMTSDIAAFASAKALTLETFLQHQKEDTERQALSNGSGILNIMGALARLTAGAALAPTVAGWQAKIDIWDAPKIREGQQVEIWRCQDSGGSSAAINSTNWRYATRLDRPAQGFYTISNVVENPSEGTATLTFTEASPGSAPPVAAGVLGDSSNFDYLVIPDSILENAQSGGTTNLGFEMLGLDAIACGTNGLATTVMHSETGVQWLQLGAAGTPFSNDLFQNLSPSSYGKWNANVIDSTTYGSTLSRACLNRATSYQNVFGTRGSNGWRMFVGHPAQINEYAQTLENAERYVIEGPTPAELPSGRMSLHQNEGMGEQLKYAGIPFYGSRMARYDRVYGVNDEGVERIFLEDFRFKPPIQAKDNTIAMEMNGIGARNMFTRNRRCLLAIHSLSKPSAV